MRRGNLFDHVVDKLLATKHGLENFATEEQIGCR